MREAPWFVYLLECKRGKIYTGVTPDIEARITKHLSGKGAQFTRINRPVKLLAIKRFASKVEAMRVEYQVKQVPANQKRHFITLWPNEDLVDQVNQKLFSGNE